MWPHLSSCQELKRFLGRVCSEATLSFWPCQPLNNMCGDEGSRDQDFSNGSDALVQARLPLANRSVSFRDGLRQFLYTKLKLKLKKL